MDFDYSEIIKNTKKAGDIHKQIKIELDTFISSNIKLIDICKFIENKIKILSSSDQINSGIAFPVGGCANTKYPYYMRLLRVVSSVGRAVGF